MFYRIISDTLRNSPISQVLFWLLFFSLSLSIAGAESLKACHLRPCVCMCVCPGGKGPLQQIAFFVTTVACCSRVQYSSINIAQPF